MDDTSHKITAATNICFHGIDFTPLMLASIGIVRGSWFRRDEGSVWNDEVMEDISWITQ